MRIYIDGEKIESKVEPAKSENREEVLCICKAENREQILTEFGFHDGLKIKYRNTCFESHKGFDYLYLSVPSEDLTNAEYERIEIYLSDKTMLLFYEDDSLVVNALRENFLSADEKIKSPKKALLEILNLLSARHLACLDDIENEIVELEDALAKEESREYVGEISILRKKLLTLRRYYESMLTLMEDLEENRNALFGKEGLRLLHFQTGKIDRLYHSTLNLRDYLTQVREAYQALLDIESNKVMKLFTVITSIFLPLTLLVGWYGMNLNMPETAFRCTYPIIIFASVAIAAGLIIYFKRNRWF